MKFQFEPDLDYQQDAIAAVCDLFRGQEIYRGEFTVAHSVDEARLPGLEENDLEIWPETPILPKPLFSWRRLPM